MSVSADEIRAEILTVQNKIAEVTNVPADATMAEKQKRLAALDALQAVRSRLNQLLTEAAAREHLAAARTKRATTDESPFWTRDTAGQPIHRHPLRKGADGGVAGRVRGVVHQDHLKGWGVHLGIQGREAVGQEAEPVERADDDGR